MIVAAGSARRFRYCSTLSTETRSTDANGVALRSRSRPLVRSPSTAVMPRAAERGKRYGKQSNPGIQIEHRSVSGNRSAHRADECGQQKAVRLEERFGVPLEGAVGGGSRCQHRSGSETTGTPAVRATPFAASPVTPVRPAAFSASSSTSLVNLLVAVGITWATR